MNSCQSPMHAWYLKYDYFTISEAGFLDCIEEIIRGLNISLIYLQADEILLSSKLNNAWINDFQFSSNSFDKRIQEFLIGILSYLMDFLKNEVACSENKEIIEKSYNLISLEVHYCQIFWKSATNKPIPDFLRDRLFCSLYRIECMLLSLHRSQNLKENEVFSGILKLLAEILKALMLEMEDLREIYHDYFNYLLRIFNLFKFFRLIEDPEALEDHLSEIFPLNLVKKIMNGLLEKSHNKNSFKVISNSYHLLIEESLSELRNNNKSEDLASGFVINRLSSKTHSNSFENNPNNEEFDVLNLLNKRTSKSIGLTLSKIEKNATDPIITTTLAHESPKLQKTLTFKDSETENIEDIPFLNQLANSYLTTQIMSTQNFYTSSNYKLNNLPIENQNDLSIIRSKMLLKSPNLPFNSMLGMNLIETTIDESLGSKIVAGIKNNKSKKINFDDQETQNQRLKPSLLSLQPSKQPSFTKKKSEIGDKLNQNLYTILLSRDSAQIRDNIVIAKNKKNGGKQTTQMENGDIEDFFEKRRKDRIIQSNNRESSMKDSGDEYMTKSGMKIEEVQKPQEKTSLQSNDERKPPRDFNKNPKTIDVKIIKEKDFIKINKMTAITDQLKAILVHEPLAQEPFDEEIMEVSEEDEWEIEEKGIFSKSSNLMDFKKTFHGDLEEKIEAFWFIPGLKYGDQLRRKNIMDFFQPVQFLSARRRGMYQQICETLVTDRNDLADESKGDCLVCKRNRSLSNIKEALWQEI